MISKEQQDLIWKCLPKEVRHEIKRLYSYHLKENERLSQSAVWNEASMHSSKFRILIDLFGKHNLTSNINPPEVLIVEKQRVDKLYNKLHDEKDVFLSTISIALLDELYPTYSSDSDRFKYNIGDLVRYKGKVKKVISRDFGGGIVTYHVTLLNGQSQLCIEESQLEPYE